MAKVLTDSEVATVKAKAAALDYRGALDFLLKSLNGKEFADDAPAIAALDARVTALENPPA